MSRNRGSAKPTQHEPTAFLKWVESTASGGHPCPGIEGVASLSNTNPMRFKKGLKVQLEAVILVPG